ncbi:hypothetical protein SPRG_17409, partial [Saprolegnia parasitica CBS 223.65]
KIEFAATIQGAGSASRPRTLTTSCTLATTSFRRSRPSATASCAVRRSAGAHCPESRAAIA